MLSIFIYLFFNSWGMQAAIYIIRIMRYLLLNNQNSSVFPVKMCNLFPEWIALFQHNMLF